MTKPYMRVYLGHPSETIAVEYIVNTFIIVIIANHTLTAGTHKKHEIIKHTITTEDSEMHNQTTYKTHFEK